MYFTTGCVLCIKGEIQAALMGCGRGEVGGGGVLCGGEACYDRTRILL